MKSALGTTLAVVLMVSNALAQPRDVAKADALFREGRAAMKAGDLQTACPKLEESYRLDPTAGTAVNLGDCFDKQGKVGSALLAYRAARKLLKPGDPRIGPVEQQTADLEKRAPRLTITLAPDAPEGVTVTRDGRAVDFADLAKAVPMNPGRVVLVVSAPGRADRNFKVVLTEGDSQEAVVDAGPLLARDDRPEQKARSNRDSSLSVRRDPPDDSRNTAGYVVGVGLLGLGLGAVFLVVKNSKDADANGIADKLPGDDACSPPSPSSQGLCKDLDDRRAEVDTYRSAEVASFIIGGLGVVTGAVILLWPDDRTTAKSSGVQVSASMGLRGGSVHGRF